MPVSLKFGCSGGDLTSIVVKISSGNETNLQADRQQFKEQFGMRSALSDGWWEVDNRGMTGRRKILL
jgi:hypothetical protein